MQAVASFIEGIKDSTLPADRETVAALDTRNWPDAFRVLASTLPDTPQHRRPGRAPLARRTGPLFDGALQTAWDRLLSHRPILLLLLGSDLHMMERLTAYDRPFYGRADNLILGPFNPAETGQALGLSGADTLDAHLVSGGLPGILRSWPHATPP